MIDLTHKLEPSTQVYPGDPPFHAKHFATIEKDGYNALHLHFGTHTGTHIDAPAHFAAGGKTIDEIDLDLLVGKAIVLPVPDRQPRERITWTDVSSKLESQTEAKIVLFRTGWSRFWKSPEYLAHPFLDGEIAVKLWDLGFRVIGVDTFSPDSTPLEGDTDEANFDIHHIWLEKGGLIVENLANLDRLARDEVMVSLLPLNIAEGDGSPIRAVAWELL
jgi:kynurenine formamidase